MSRGGIVLHPCAAPPAPGANETITLYEHSVPDSGTIQHPTFVMINFLRIDQPSATNGLRAYGRARKDGTLREVTLDGLPSTVPASPAADDDIREFYCLPYPHFVVKFTQSATPAGLWEVVITQVFGMVP